MPIQMAFGGVLLLGLAPDSLVHEILWYCEVLPILLQPPRTQPNEDKVTSSNIHSIKNLISQADSLSKEL